MKPPKRINRRGFLILCGVSVAAASGGAVRLLRDDEEKAASTEPLTPRVAEALQDRGSAEAVGRAYLEANPREDGERRLIQLLRASNRDWPLLSDPNEIRKFARVQARRDYAAGRTAEVEGWYISLTEARLCALVTFA